MITARIEDEADLWLKKHDPYYSKKSSKKMQKEPCPYETPELEKRRMQMEIPFSQLSLNQRMEVPEVTTFGGDIVL